MNQSLPSGSSDSFPSIPNPQITREELEAQRTFLKKVADGTAQNADYLHAAHSYTQQATHGDALAQYNLGIMHCMGQGVPRDTAEAAIWFRRAANQGNAAAQHRLGMEQQRCSFNPAASGAQESRIEAYKWFSLSAAQGYIGSAECSSQMAVQMTHEDVSEGNRRIAAFQPVAEPGLEP